MKKRKAFGIISLVLVGLTLVFAAVTVFGFISFNKDFRFKGRDYYVSEIEKYEPSIKEAEALIEHYERMISLGGVTAYSYAESLEDMLTAKEAMEDRIETCEEKIEDYDQYKVRNIVFLVLTILSAMGGVIFFVLFKKSRKALPIAPTDLSPGVYGA